MLPTYYNHLRPIPFRNDSGETIPPFSVMRITGVNVSSGNVAYTVSKPNATFQRFYLVNNHVAVPNGKHGSGNDGRFVGAKVNWTGAGGYGASPSSWELEKNRPGFTLLETPSSAGVYKVFQEPINVVMATADATIAADASGDATIRIDGATDGPWDPITAVNDFVDNSTAVAANAKFFAVWNHAEEIWQIIKGGAGGSSDLCTLMTTYANDETLDTAKEWVVKLKYVTSAWTCVAVEVETACT